MVYLLASVWVYVIWGINDMSDVLPFRSYSSLIDHSYFKHTLYASYSILRRISYLPNLPPLEIWHKLLCCHNFETICNTCGRGVIYYLVWSHDQVMQEQ